jgi:tRNA(Ile)-lysidine synthase
LLTGLHQQVRRTIHRHGLLAEGSRVLVAVSGGSDSVALTRLLRDLAEHGSFTVVGLAHMNHGLRTTSDRDEAFCRDLARHLGLPIQVAQGRVLEYAAEHRLSTEEAARTIRYSFLEDRATAVGADRIAVGHTRDDQAETVLMKLVRGAGPVGLSGIYPRRGRVIRPLLEVSRSALRAWLERQGASWMEDETNEDISNPRNRLRLRVLPELAEVLGGDPRRAIAQVAALVREDSEWLESQVDTHVERLVRRGGAGIQADLAGVQALPTPLQRRLLRRALCELAGQAEVGFEHVEAVRALLRGKGGAVDVPGGRVELSAGMLVLIERKASSK